MKITFKKISRKMPLTWQHMQTSDLLENIFGQRIKGQRISDAFTSSSSGGAFVYPINIDDSEFYFQENVGGMGFKSALYLCDALGNLHWRFEYFDVGSILPEDYARLYSTIKCLTTKK